MRCIFWLFLGICLTNLACQTQAKSTRQQEGRIVKNNLKVIFVWQVDSGVCKEKSETMMMPPLQLMLKYCGKNSTIRFSVDPNFVVSRLKQDQGRCVAELHVLKSLIKCKPPVKKK